MSNIDATAAFLQTMTDKERDLLMELCTTLMVASHAPTRPVNLVVLGRSPAPAVPQFAKATDLEPGIGPETQKLVKRAIELDPALEELIIRIANTSFVDGENDFDEQYS